MLILFDARALFRRLEVERRLFIVVDCLGTPVECSDFDYAAIMTLNRELQPPPRPLNFPLLDSVYRAIDCSILPPQSSLPSKGLCKFLEAISIVGVVEEGTLAVRPSHLHLINNPR